MKNLILFLMCISQLMSANIDWAFPPEVISSSGQSADNPRTAIDANGNAIAIWLENGFIKTKSKPVGMSWSTETTLSAFGASDPNIVCDLNGNATALWLENGFIKSASKTLGGNWSSPLVLSHANATSPCIAIDLEGDVIAAWVRNGDIQTTTKLFGGNWQATSTINASNSAKPHIAIGGSGAKTRTAIVWQAVVNQVNIIYGSTKLISASAWGNKQILSDVTHQAGFAKTAVDTNGNITAVWFAYDLFASNYSRVLVQSTTKKERGEWTHFATLSEPGIGNPANLSLEVSYDWFGNAIALWNTTFDHVTFSIQSAIKPTYGNWSNPITLVMDNLFAYHASLSLVSLGDALALYMFYNGLNVLIQSSELDIISFLENTWTLPLTLSNGSINAKPFLTSSINENKIHIAATWLSPTGNHNSVLATTGSKSIPLPPSNLSVLQNSTDFGVFREYQNILSWQASIDPSVVGYLIFRNGLFLAQVDSQTFEYIDRNQVQNGSVIYGITSIDGQATRGKIATIQFP